MPPLKERYYAKWHTVLLGWESKAYASGPPGGTDVLFGLRNTEPRQMLFPYVAIVRILYPDKSNWAFFFLEKEFVFQPKNSPSYVGNISYIKVKS